MRQRYFKGLRKHTEGTFFSHPRRSLIFNGGGLKKTGCGLDDEDEKRSCLVRQRR